MKKYKVNKCYKSFAIVNNPLQLSNLVEYIECEKLQKVLLVVPYINIEKSRSIFLNELNKQKIYFEDIYYIDDKNLFFRYIEYLNIIRKYKNCIFDNLIFGNISKIHKFLLPNITSKNYILIDDGLLSISLFKKLLNKTRLLSSKYKFLGLKIFWDKEITFFTFLDLPSSDKIKKNNCLLFHINNSQKINDNEVVIIGQDVVRAMILEKETYQSIIETIILQNIYQQIYYFPHPGESDLKLHYELCSKYSNYKIKHIDIKFESYFFSLKILPKRIYSLFSTSLYILSKYYKDLEFISIVLNDSEIKNRIKIIKEAYTVIESNNSIIKDYR